MKTESAPTFSVQMSGRRRVATAALRRVAVSGAVLICGAGVVSPGMARAHALLTAPSPRDSSDAHKDPTGPCGVARSAAQPLRSLPAGGQFNVTWNETISHPGCFLIDFSAAGDTSFQMLATVAHRATGALPRAYAQMVTLPAAPCAACTLRVRQIMLGAEPAAGACPPVPLPTGATYYTCANVALAGSAAADAGATDAASGGPGSGGAMGSGGDTGNPGGGIATGGASGTASTGGTTGGGTPTASGGAGPVAAGGGTGNGPGSGSGGTTGSGVAGADQTGGCACTTGAAPIRQKPAAAATSVLLMLFVLRRRSRKTQKP